MAKAKRSVFINCPFDADYDPAFQAIWFTVLACGFEPRCALEISDSSQNRLDKICSMIEVCDLGIHDLCRTDLDPVHHLPRFNMPFELGLFIGSKRFGGKRSQRKNALVFDRDQYRYQKFISDIAGSDIAAHNGHADLVVESVRSWLTQFRQPIPSGKRIQQFLRAFISHITSISRELHPSAPSYRDQVHMARHWLASAAKAGV